MDVMADSRPTLNPTEVSIRQAVTEELFQFPLLVKTTTGDEHLYEIGDQQNQLLADCLLLLGALDTPCYAHVRVVGLEDEAQVARDKGMEYVAEYNRMLGKDFLVPAALPHKLKIVHKQGTSRLYTSVAQVIEYPPRYLKAETDILSCVPDSDTIVKVKKGKTLEVAKVFSANDVTYLRCVHNKTYKSYFFSQHSSVSFAAVDDTAAYTLADIISKQPLLPKVVRFQECVSPDEVVEYDDDAASRALLMTFGPLEVMGRKRRHFIVGWLRIKDSSSSSVSYRQVLIPRSHWDSVKVRVLSFKTEKAKKAYYRRKFPVACSATMSYEDKLYLLRPESSVITYLMGCGGEDDDSSGESSGYEIPTKATPPAVVPPRQGIQMKDSNEEDTTAGESSNPLRLPTRKVRPDAMQKVLEKAKSGFGHLHNELLYFFKVRGKSDKTPTERPTSDVETDKQKSYILPISQGNDYVKTPVATRQHSDRSSNRNNRETWNPPLNNHPVTDGGEQPGSPVKTRPQSDKASNRKYRETWALDTPTVQPGSRTRPLPQEPSPADSSSQVAPQLPPKPLSRSNSVPGPKPRVPPPPDDRPPPPIPDQMLSVKQEDLLYDYPDFKDWVPPGKTQTPVDTNACAVEAKKETSVNQTVNEFQNYSVSQVAECFRTCALNDLAQIFEEEMIDGKFLATFNLDELKDEPFCLKEFSLTKVKKIIHEGWRPSFDNT